MNYLKFNGNSKGDVKMDSGLLRMAEIGQFASGLIHDLNNEMTSVLGSFEMVKENFPLTENSDQSARMRALSDSLERMKNILVRTQLMIRDGGIIREPESIIAIIERSIEHVQKNLLLENIPSQIEKNYDFEIPLLLLDKIQLDRVFVNLINNCCQAMREDNRKCIIRISLCQDIDNCYIVFQDKGPGISDSIMKNQNQAFSTTRKSSGGSGIGLMIVREIIAAHKGALLMDNGISGGAKFIVSIPKKPAL